MGDRDDNGELAERIRSYDWASTGLGEPADWPQQLRTMVDVMLASNQPMFLVWGSEHIFVYNDACVSVLEERHPEALGRPLREVFADASDRIVELVDEAFDGESSRLGETSAVIDGRYVNLSFTPIPADDGNVRGALAVCRDVTEHREWMEALQESERRYRAAFRMSPIVLTISSVEDGRFIEVNDAFEQVLGYSREEVIGRSAIKLGLWPDLERRQELAQRMREQGRLKNAEIDISTKSGERKTVVFSAEMISVDGDSYAMTSLVDITERRRAEEELRQAHALLDGITRGTEDMIAALDEDFRYLYFNGAYHREFQDMWGVDLEIGMSLVEALEPWPEEQRATKKLWERALDGETFSIMTEIGPAEDDKRFYDMRFNPVYDEDGELIGAAEILRDVTERVRAQETLRKREEELREADRRKDEYLAMLGHELRNPLAAVQSATDLVKLTATDDHPQLKHASGVLERQTEHMARLVDGLLDVSRIARGKIELEREPIDVAHILETVLEDTEARISEKGLTLETNLPSEPIWISGDPVRITQIFSNLLGNAIKFTESSGCIAVELYEEDDEAVIRVEDTGVGIRREMLTSIFEPFRQEVQDMARLEGGLGLGLALVKGLVEGHGGTIEAHSEGPGTGAEFEIRFPVLSEPPEDPEA